MSNRIDKRDRTRLVVETTELLRRAVRLRVLKHEDNVTSSDVVNEILTTALADEIAEVQLFARALKCLQS